MRSLCRKERRPCCLDRKSRPFRFRLREARSNPSSTSATSTTPTKPAAGCSALTATTTAATTSRSRAFWSRGRTRNDRRPISFRTATTRSELFRAIEASHPEIEHLGNWHTHHVNGYPTLSGGDKTTYFKTVNHEKHNTDFFYALLVVGKNRGGNPRYAVKHFIFRRGDDDDLRNSGERRAAHRCAAAPARHMRATLPRCAIRRRDGPSERANPERAKDQEFFAEFYPGLKPLLSKDIGAPLLEGTFAAC